MTALVTLLLMAAVDGTALFHARRYVEAEQALRTRIAARPADEQAHLYLARTLIELDRVADALAELERITSPQSSPEVHYQAGLILRQLAERRFRDLENVAPG